MEKMLINGEFVDGLGEENCLKSPINGQELVTLREASVEQTNYALESAEKAFRSWSKTSLKTREKYIRKLIELLNRDREIIKEILISETGKPEANAEYDFQMLPDCLNFFIEEAKRLNGQIVQDAEGTHLNMLIRKPIGVVCCHLAWNFPILNIAYKLGPILASGCTCVMKPSSKTPLATLYIAKLIKEAKIPSGVINIIMGRGSVVSKVMNESLIPSMITAIGSTRTGRNIIAQSATSIKQFSLELGGNAPVLVLKDADVKKAAFLTADGKFGNNGQTCVSPNRIFVHEAVKDEFIKEILEYTKRITLGSGNDAADILVGPMIDEKALEFMVELTADAVSKGANVLTGGKKANREGYFFEPTIITECTKDMRFYQEEIFGPIMPIYSFTETDDLVELANDTEFGLAAYVYTSNLDQALYLGNHINAGSVLINEPHYSCELPHGGLKQSGVGKDCSTISLEEYYDVQRITIKTK
jgi:succinate-semialdehyde dehydrogenase/glutarate-semialdehyde dehydrogenase